MRVVWTIYQLGLGVALLALPWSRFWRESWFVWHAGQLRPWLLSGVLRGAISGLGAAILLDAAGWSYSESRRR
jgi:hypothetical protein